jgi:hypothetical protein
MPEWWACNCDAILMDFTNAEARAWWWDEHRELIDSGVAGLWTDLGEPERHPDDMVHALGPAPAVHNIFNLLWAETVADGLMRDRPGERIFNLTRSGYAGLQRTGSVTWSGDVARTEGGLAVQIPLMLGAGMSGLAYHGSDLGGFAGEATPELYVRWLQLGALAPIARAHGVDNTPTEPYGFGQQAERIVRDALRLRYRFLPTLYTLTEAHHRTGVPIARPLFFADPSDAALANDASAFMLGEDIIVAPVIDPDATSKTVRLPRGAWVEAWINDPENERVMEGGRSVTVDAPFDRLPLFIREGSLLVLGPALRYSDERPADTLTVVAYPSATENGRFDLYEDDGETTDYMAGKSARTVIESTTLSASPSYAVTVGAADGAFEGLPTERVYVIDIRRVAQAPRSVLLDGVAVPSVASPAELIAAGDGFVFIPDENRLLIQTTGSVHAERIVGVEELHVLNAEAAPVIPEVAVQAFPTPFRGSTTIEVSMHEAGKVDAELFDMLGRRVATLEGGMAAPGTLRMPLKAVGLASGLFLARVRIRDATGSIFSRNLPLIHVR